MEPCQIRALLIEEHATASTLYAEKVSAFRYSVVGPNHDSAFAEMRRVLKICEDARLAIDEHVKEHRCDERQAGSAGA